MTFPTAWSWAFTACPKYSAYLSSKGWKFEQLLHLCNWDNCLVYNSLEIVIFLASWSTLFVYRLIFSGTQKRCDVNFWSFFSTWFSYLWCFTLQTPDTLTSLSADLSLHLIKTSRFLGIFSFPCRIGILCH